MTIIRALLVFAVFISVVRADAPLSAAEARIERLGAATRHQRTHALREAVNIGPPAIPALLRLMDRGELTSTKLAGEALNGIVAKVAGTKRQAEAATKLADAILDSKHTDATRRAACDALGYVAGGESINSLYKAMNDSNLQESARAALVRIPDRGATTALMAAIQLGEPAMKIAVLNALGERGDASATPALLAQLQSSDADVATAALAALARIPAAARDAIVQALESKRPAAIDAALTFAERAIDAKMETDALECLLKLIDEPLTAAQRCRWLNGLGRIGGEIARNSIIHALGDKDAHIRGAAMEAAVLLPEGEMTTILARKMSTAPPELRFELLGVLGRRGATLSQEAAELIRKAAVDDNPRVALAVAQAIESAAIDSAVGALLRLIHHRDATVRAAAEHALHHLPGPFITKQILYEWKAHPDMKHAMLLRALGRRGDASVLPAIVDATRNAELEIRLAAIEALGASDNDGAFETIVALTNSQEPRERDATIEALSHLRSDTATSKLIAHYAESKPEQRPKLLTIVARRANAQATTLLLKELASDNAEIRTAAAQGLRRHVSPGSLSVLIDAIKTGADDIAQPAMHACFNLAAGMEPAEPAAAGKVYLQLLPLAKNDGQRRQILAGIRRIGAACPPLAVEAIKPLLSGPLHAEAAAAVVDVASELPDERDEAVEVLRHVATAATERDVIDQAADRLRSLGIDYDPGREAGFITHWWFVGPFPNPNGAMWTQAYSPEQKVDLAAEVKIEDRSRRWKPFHTASPHGIVEMDVAIAQKNDIGAYGYAEIDVDRDQDVLLKIGSDDSIVVWLNRQQVHANRTGRVVKVDEDQAKAKLVKGTNRFLVKILNGNFSWGFCIRVTTPDGKPVAFRQKG